jgi:hypothetical protein
MLPSDAVFTPRKMVVFFVIRKSARTCSYPSPPASLFSPSAAPVLRTAVFFPLFRRPACSAPPSQRHASIICSSRPHTAGCRSRSHSRIFDFFYRHACAVVPSIDAGPPCSAAAQGDGARVAGLIGIFHVVANVQITRRSSHRQTCRCAQLISSAAEALAGDVLDLLQPSLHRAARAAPSDAASFATPMKSRQQPQPQPLPPPRVPLQEDGTDGAEAQPGVVAFKRRTVVSHDGGTVTSAVADAATVSHSDGCSASASDVLDTAIIDSEPLTFHVSLTPLTKDRPSPSPFPTPLHPIGDGSSSPIPSPSPVALDVSSFVTVRISFTLMSGFGRVTLKPACARSAAVLVRSRSHAGSGVAVARRVAVFSGAG